METVIWRARNPKRGRFFIAKNKTQAIITVKSLNAKSRVKDWVWNSLR